jgi:hypothetical protein
MTSTLWVVLLGIGLVAPDLQRDSVVTTDRNASQRRTPALAIEPDVSGIYLPRAARDEDCIPERRGAIVLPPLAVGRTHISQTSHFVIIRNQQITRVIPLRPIVHVMHGVASYLGSPQGRWEGDTLVIESTGLRTETVAAMSAFSAQAIEATHARIVERLTLVDASTLRYEFTLEASYVKPLNVQVQLARLSTDSDTETSHLGTCLTSPTRGDVGSAF